MANLLTVGKLILIASVLGATGCASMDRVSGKMDMAGNHIGEPSSHEFEGRIEAIAKIGDMTSIQFADERYYNVERATPGLQPGDTVRIYKTENGMEARLWKAAPQAQISAAYSEQSGS